jgi:hypothetical protein
MPGTYVVLHGTAHAFADPTTHSSVFAREVPTYTVSLSSVAAASAPTMVKRIGSSVNGFGISAIGG